MRLIHAQTRTLTYFQRSDAVKYAVLSHRWEEDEITLQDLNSSKVESKKGYAKFISACDETVRAGLSYVWIDTCCIDKTSSAELSEAINSMYKWYQEAEVCFAYLSDVEQLSGLGQSLWFTRGWTLQELVAPKNLKFYDKHWRCFGSKTGLQARLSDLTGIPVRVLRADDRPSVVSVAQRMSWAAGRVTTRLEDQAYCLMGLFEINMPLLYGEGSNAYLRLQEEIIKTSDDHSIFAWTSGDHGRKGILAPSPACFRDAANTVSTAASSMPEHYSTTNVGLSIRLPVLPWTTDVYMAVLQCNNKDTELEKQLMPHARRATQNLRLGILLRKTSRIKQFVRIALHGCDLHTIDIMQHKKKLKVIDLLILLRPKPTEDPDCLYGFVFRNFSSTLSVFEPVSHNTSVSEMWSSRRYHDLRTWLPDNGNPGYKILSDDQQVMVYNLVSGNQGIVVSFQQQSSDVVNAIEFGFDFDFNPVCMVYKMDALERHRLLGYDKWSPDDCQDIEEKLKIYQDMPLYQSWNEYGVCAIRSSQLGGLQAHLGMLNIHVGINEGWRNDHEKAWIVDIDAISLPHVIVDHEKVRWREAFGAKKETKLEEGPDYLQDNKAYLGPAHFQKESGAYMPAESEFERMSALLGWTKDSVEDQMSKSLEWFRNEVSNCLREEAKLRRARNEEMRWLKSEDRLRQFRRSVIVHITGLRDDRFVGMWMKDWLDEQEKIWLQENTALDKLHREASRRKQEDQALRRLQETSQDHAGHKQ